MIVSARAKRRSKRFRQLEKELTVLKRHFLPKKFSPTGTYPDYVYSKAAAYRAFVHAEIESFVEDRVQDLFRTVHKAYKTSGKVCRTLICMVAFSGMEMANPPVSVQAPQPNQQKAWDEDLHLAEKLKKVVNRLEYEIMNNHGVKEENLLKLLLPTGIEVGDIDNLWLVAMNSFGTDRGRVAHQSRASYRVMHQIDPKSEFDRVHNLLGGLKAVDEKINQLMQS